jgi:hypothetical protein
MAAARGVRMKAKLIPVSTIAIPLPRCFNPTRLVIIGIPEAGYRPGPIPSIIKPKLSKTTVWDIPIRAKLIEVKAVAETIVQ